MKPKITLGADPEIFLKDASDSLVSAIGRIGGSKEAPKKLPIGKGFAVQEDNVAIEYNIPPSQSQAIFVRNITLAMKYLLKQVQKQGLSFDHSSAASFPEKQLEHPAARVFGCDPDFNAWMGSRRNPPPAAPDPNLRSAGGHVHVGAAFDNQQEIEEFIQRCDLFLAVPSVILDADGATRRLLYGRPGAYRPKPYGCEYRTLSNFWVFNPKYTAWVWHNTCRAYQDRVDLSHDKEQILSSIMCNDKAAAQELISKYDIQMA